MQKNDGANYALSDFVAPKDSGTIDYIGAFAVSIHGAKEMADEFKRAGDDYNAILLEALIASRPKHPIIPKLVRGLLDHRKAGSWENTQENGWALLALDAYFQRYEKVTPDFVARVWLGDAGHHVVADVDPAPP